MNEEEKDMNNLIQDFYEYSTDYFKTTCDYYEKYLRDYQKKKIQLQNNWNELKKWLIQLQKLKGINQQGFSWGVAQEVLDKMQELEGNNDSSRDVF